MNIASDLITGAPITPATDLQVVRALVDLSNNDEADYCGARIVKNYICDFTVTFGREERQCHDALEAIGEADLLARRAALKGWA